MLKKLLGAIDSARRALSSEMSLIREGLTGLELNNKDLAAQAADFVVQGCDPAILLRLAALNGSASWALGRPGRLGWGFHNGHQGSDVESAANTSRAGRFKLYQRVVNTPEHVAMLVRLGKVLEAADQRQELKRTCTSAPDWLQYLLNDALWASYPRGAREAKDEDRPAWDVNLIAALLADDGFNAAVTLPIIFERQEVDSYFLDITFRRLLASGPLDTYMLAHAADVEATSKVLSANGRALLASRIGSNPKLLSAFSALLLKLAVNDSKTVRATAARFIDRMDSAHANAILAELLRNGQSEERANAADLLARTQGEAVLPLLEAALTAESGKSVQQVIRGAIARLQAAGDAQDLELPEPPALPPAPTEVLADDVLELLRQNRADLQERWRSHAETETEYNRSAKYPTTHRRETYQRFRDFSDGQLREAIKALNGQGDQRILSNSETDAILSYGNRVTARSDFGLLQLLRWTCSNKRTSWTVWSHPYFQSWLTRQDKSTIDLRQLAALVKQCGGEEELILRDCLRETNAYFQTPQQVLPADRVWPLFADRPDLIDEALGMAAGSKDTFARHAPTMGGALSVLAAFPVVPARWLPRLMELALGEGKTHRAAAQQVLARMPDIGKRVCETLQSTKQELRIEAARWLVTLNYRTGIADLRKALEKETRETAAAALMTALEQLGEDISPMLAPERLLAQARKGLKAKIPAGLAWLNLDTIPTCTWLNGTPVESDILRWWVILACKLKEPGGNALLERYMDLLAQPGRAALSTWVLQQFIAQDTRHPPLEEGTAHATAHAAQRYQQYQHWAQKYPDYYVAQGKLTQEQVFEELKREKMSEYLGSAINEKGLLALISGMPGHQIVSAIQQYMRDHYQRRAQVESLLEAACVSNDPSVIQFTLGIARRYRTASVQEKARLLVQRIADRNGWSQDQLADRTVPTGGLDDSGTLLLAYGSRSYSVTLDAAMKPVLRNEEGKAVSTLPAPRQDDAPEAIKEAKQQFTACKKEIKQVVEMQTSRLYEAMCAGRTWPAAEWQEFLQRHPVVGRLVQRLVWQEIGADGAVTHCFRPTEDGSLIDTSDDEITLNEQSSVRLAHGALLDDTEAAAWTAHFKDYKLTPLFAQMTRKTPPALNGETVSDREGWISDTFTLRGAFTKRGYQRGSAEDGGVFFEYRKDFVSAGFTVVMEFSGSSLPEENIPAALKTLSFRSIDGGRHNYRPTSLEKVPPILLAEAYNDYHAVATACSGFDPDWQKKMPW